MSNFDAFNRLRTSVPAASFTSVLTDDEDALAWSSSTSGSGNIAYASNASVSVDVY